MEKGEINWDDIVEHLGPRLYRYFCGSFSRASASDAVQETLLRLVQKVRDGSFDVRKGDLAAYGFGIAHWIRIEMLKTTDRLVLTDDDSVLHSLASPTLPENLEVETQRIRLREAILRLKPVEQDVVLLSIDSELKLEQIAETLGLPVGTVKSHLHRAKENLRKFMEASYER
jgi:RNA polymerase sigma-70 factor (ECF subfamily)